MQVDIENSNAPTKLSFLQWSGVAILFAGFVYLLVTENIKAWSRFNFLAATLIVVDYFIKSVTHPVRPPSLLAVQEKPRAKVKVGPLAWVAFALMALGAVFVPHPRFVALFFMAAIFLLLLNQYKETRNC